MSRKALEHDQLLLILLLLLLVLPARLTRQPLQGRLWVEPKPAVPGLIPEFR